MVYKFTDVIAKQDLSLLDRYLHSKQCRVCRSKDAMRQHVPVNIWA